MSATDTVTNAPNSVTDAGKNLLGGRKPTDLTQGELDKASGKELQGVVNEAAKTPKTKTDDDKSSLRIHIELDLDVEVHLTARVKGDITIGLL